jgi:hypothetical protein
MSLDVLPQPGVHEVYAGTAADAPGPPPWWGRRTGTIRLASRCVADILAAHGAGSPPQHRRHGPQRLAVGQVQAQGLTFCVTQMRIASLCHGNTVAD